MNTPKVDPTQQQAEERLGTALRNLLLIVAALALIGVVLPGENGVLIESLAVGLVVALPFVRIVWLMKRWWAQGDFRFVRWALSLLVLVAVGPVLALL